MPVLPVPMIIALLLFGLLVHRALTRTTHPALLALIAGSAVQSAVIALVHYYGITTIRPVQALLATLIAPIAWIAFSQAAGGMIKLKHVWAHAIGLAAAIICLSFNPMWLDVVIPVSFAGYGGAMLLHLMPGEDSLPHSRLESGSTSVWAWRIVATSLVASAACDVFISYSLATGGSRAVLWVPSLVSSLSLLSLGALGLSHAIESQPDEEKVETTPSQSDMEKDQAVIATLEEHMRLKKPFLDPDLTLARLSRKLVLPAKQVSAAINRVKGENVSRYINRQRIEEACRLLSDGHNITSAMFESGFNTKSNFNREFLRVKGVNPSAWAVGKKPSSQRAAWLMLPRLCSGKSKPSKKYKFPILCCTVGSIFLRLGLLDHRLGRFLLRSGPDFIERARLFELQILQTFTCLGCGRIDLRAGFRHQVSRSF